MYFSIFYLLIFTQLFCFTIPIFSSPFSLCFLTPSVLSFTSSHTIYLSLCTIHLHFIRIFPVFFPVILPFLVLSPPFLKLQKSKERVSVVQLTRPPYFQFSVPHKIIFFQYQISFSTVQCLLLFTLSYFLFPLQLSSRRFIHRFLSNLIFLTCIKLISNLITLNLSILFPIIISSLFVFTTFFKFLFNKLNFLSSLT